MHTYDFLMIAVIIGCTVFGAWKGMVWQLASLGSLVVSYLVALQFSDQLSPYIDAKKPWDRVVAMLILYIATAVIIWLGFRFVAKVIDRIKLREFDRQLGALFGAAKGVLLSLVITFFAVSLSENAQGMVRESKSGLYMARFLDHAHPLIPHDVHEVLHPYFEQLRHGVDPNAPHDPHHAPDHQERPGQVAGGGGQPGTRSTSHQPSGPGLLERIDGAVQGVEKVFGGGSEPKRPEPKRPEPKAPNDSPGLDELFELFEPTNPQPRSGSRRGDRRT